ncbi:M16 family metallopeptidase [Niabella drilacis]|uniref:Predicted Zn-dependent peptidase n=1 Tax=Niabella drilacis (strain DSM 25811 / CCM 8410 / CCUG 62505 / LMG 26954 / E90) TaxID=1285928 RepID=A0A1G6XTN7_NIADE|nr:pitrilysin family protein [Niabella drilacis]SDD81564.1 Predicted Zn-dependent peptidase [Niabella drilacis]
MIQFDKFTLANGLRVIVHQDKATPTVVMNILYDVGARDEVPHQTGFAHLFEHLMFGGSVNIPEYDEPLQLAGGENNAYTTNDLTNYYIQIPKENIETAFWLESDRMLSLAFSEKSLEVQRKVVCEEFKEHYLEKPYGDAWFKMRELAYKQHPYRWMTIGKELSHIENAQLEDVKRFFFKHYRPSNAVMVVAGNITTEAVKALSEKWFGDIPAGDPKNREVPAELPQTEARRETVTADVPLDAFYKCWHIGGRLSPEYYVADLLTDILGGGESSRLFEKLVKELQLFVNIQCYHMGSIDPGIICIEGKLVKGVDMKTAEAAIEKILQHLKEAPIMETELQKVKNKTESMMAFEDMSLLNRANSLAFYELLGDAGMMNTELDRYSAVTTQDIQATAQKIFREENSSTLYYQAKH